MTVTSVPCSRHWAFTRAGPRGLPPGRGRRDAATGRPDGTYRAYVRPSFLQTPEIALYTPFAVAYIALGGETEAGRGPNTLHAARYLVVVGLLVATVARCVRKRRSEGEN